MQEFTGTFAEWRFSDALRQEKKISGYKIDKEQCLSTALASPLGRRRLDMAEPFLKQEYGVPIRRGNFYRISFNWNSVPVKVLLDHVYGIDYCVTLYGYSIAIDVTCNSNSFVWEQKQQRLKYLAPLWQALGFDNAGVCPLLSQGRSVLSALKAIRDGQTIVPTKI